MALGQLTRGGLRWHPAQAYENGNPVQPMKPSMVRGGANGARQGNARRIPLYLTHGREALFP